MGSGSALSGSKVSRGREVQASHLEGVKPPLEAARQGVRQALKLVLQIRCKFLTCHLQGTLQQEALGRVRSLPGKKAQCVLPLGPLKKDGNDPSTVAN